MKGTLEGMLDSVLKLYFFSVEYSDCMCFRKNTSEYQYFLSSTDVPMLPPMPGAERRQEDDTDDEEEEEETLEKPKKSKTKPSGPKVQKFFS